MAKSSNNKAVNKEYAEQLAQEISGKLLGRPKGLAKDIKAYVDNKLQNPRGTHMFIANDKIAQAFYYKMIAFNGIISSAKYGLGTDYDFDDIKVIFEKAKEIEKAMDEFIDYAYTKGIGSKKQIERYMKAKEEAQANEEAAQ